MAVIVSTESAYAAEMRKWEAHHSQYGAPERPYDPNVKWPAMFYLVQQGTTTLGPEIVDRVIAEDEDQGANLRSRGFGNGLAEAMALYEQRTREVATIAAHRNYEDRNMSERAKAEIAQVEAETLAHVPEIPAAPKRRGRTPKTAQTQ